jgi:DNA invertase Pin-like site-specific DNA recombinase
MLTSDTLKPLAYSYIRFSSAQQSIGDSLRRQVELTESYCAEHGLTLVRDSAYLYRDLGVSAFRGKNSETGALSEFIAAVNSGIVPQGSYLIIENFDRLSRAEISVALPIFLSIINAGILVVTLSDGRLWTKDSVADPNNLAIAVSSMLRAHDESKRRSELVAAAWGQKKKRAADGTATTILTTESPRWLKANADRTGFEVIPELAESVRRVFAMRINGASAGAICVRANHERWLIPGNGPVGAVRDSRAEFADQQQTFVKWHLSLVNRILKNRAVLGEYQPHRIDEDTGDRVADGEPVQGYYPPIIDETTFLRAQSTSLRRGSRPGRRDPEARNWLYGLVKCGACGNSLMRKTKSGTKQPYSRHYCISRVRGETKCESVNSDQLETLVGYAAASWLPDLSTVDPVLEMLRARADLLEVERENTDERPKEQELARLYHEMADRTIIGDIDELRARLQQISHETEAVASGRAGVDRALRLREELARVFHKIVVHQLDGYIEFFVKGRTAPVFLPLDFASLEPPVEPTAAQLAAAECDIAASSLSVAAGRSRCEVYEHD